MSTVASASGTVAGFVMSANVSPLTFAISPEIIRFASPRMFVQVTYDLAGGSVDF
jgi:hypothetical protein